MLATTSEIGPRAAAPPVSWNEVGLSGDLVVPFALDCLAIVAGDTGNHLPAARLFGRRMWAASR